MSVWSRQLFPHEVDSYIHFLKKLHICIIALLLLSHFSHVTLCDSMDSSPARLLCPWDFPGKNTGVGCHSLLQGIFQTPRIEPASPVSPALQTDSLLLKPFQIDSGKKSAWQHLTMQEMWVQSLDPEYPLQKEMGTNSNILVYEIPRIEEPGGLQLMRSQKSQTWLSD